MNAVDVGDLVWHNPDGTPRIMTVTWLDTDDHHAYVFDGNNEFHVPLTALYPTLPYVAPTYHRSGWWSYQVGQILWVVRSIFVVLFSWSIIAGVFLLPIALLRYLDVV